MSIQCKYIYKDRDLFDYIIFGELSPKEFTNNQKIIEELGSNIEKIQKLRSGYCLMTVDIKKTHNLILIVHNSCGSTYSQAKYRVYKITEPSAIENPVSFKLEEMVDNIDLSKFIYDTNNNSLGASLRELDIVSMIITDTLDGYKVNTSRVEEFRKKIENYSRGVDTSFTRNPIININEKPLITRIHMCVVDQIRNTTRGIRARIDKLLDRVDKDSQHIRYKVEGILDPTVARRADFGTEATVVVSHIDDVRKIGNKRVAFIENYRHDKKHDNSMRQWRWISEYQPGSGPHLVSKETHYVYNHAKRSITSTLEAIPYNFIDKGRYIVTMGNSSIYTISVVSNDPRNDPKFLENLMKGIAIEVDACLKDNIVPGDTKLRDKETNTDIYLADYAGGSNNVRKLQRVLSGIKSMADEFLYTVKRQKAKGSDIKITDNVMYDHKEGKLKYNDFSIAVDHEAIKESVHVVATDCMREHFRDEKSEQEVIDTLVAEYFNRMEHVLNSWSKSEKVINVTINNEVKVRIESNRGKNNFTYLNGQRLNKNEVLTIMKEITCYRSNKTAAAFISTIGKLGLSVYIGITSGYLYNKKVYKFKKEKGRSNYKLIIDDIEVDMKGKKLLNKLYETVQLGAAQCYSIEETQSSIDELVFRSIVSPSDYIKYRFLIDASYEAFIKRSKEFLDKKVTDVEGKHIKYYDTNRKEILEGVRLQGSSGNWYIVAYDSKESFVFMNPSEEGTKDTYKEGTYICMIDQSNIKSNIGYDTVVAKMLSLKNDSMIASQIYNLEEELAK